ncbi:hypothetical protein ACLB2K_030522 [Fragaria x ananassa]
MVLNPSVKLWHKIWDAPVPSKVKICGWKAAANILPSRSRLSQRGIDIDIDTHCPLCDEEVETPIHALRDCAHAETFLQLAHVPVQLAGTNVFDWLESSLDMDKSWISLPRYHRKYAEGVWDFMQYAQANADGSGMFYCPCKMCKCRSDMHRFPLGTVWDHLKSNGFWERYTCWIYHGETSSRPHDHGQFDETGSTSNDPTTTFINDMFPHDSGVCPERQHIPQAPMQAVPRGVNTAGIAKYNRLIAFQQTPLCPGHEKTVLQCVMEVMHIKVDTKSTVTAVDRYLQYAASLLPDGHRHPTTHHKVRRILRDLGLSYIKIHACRYDCVLFWGKDALGVTIPGPEADAYQEPNAVGIHDVATVRQNNVKHGRVLRIRDEDSTFIDVDPNEETDDDSDDELRHRLPDINSDTEEDSSDDSDYEP